LITDEGHLENTTSLQQNGDHRGGNNDLILTDVKPFNNNPPLPHTQR
jgi:hypothetical protein